MTWFTIKNIDRFDSPMLVLYKNRVEENIDKAIRIIGNVELLRPHVKTNKMAEVCRVMLNKGINKFKCATIAEAEMLARINAPDVLLAYQPIGPKIDRFLKLVTRYPDTAFSCMVDNLMAAREISDAFSRHNKDARLFIDVNTGMNRTGASKEQLFELIDVLVNSPALDIVGVHAYDGHIKDREVAIRQQKSDAAFALVDEVVHYTQDKLQRSLQIVVAGSPSFSTHLHRKIQCSPGTFVFWDWGYKHLLPNEPYEIAALVITRIISIVDESTLTTDLGYKAIAAENPLPRVYFLNAPGMQPVMQSEEHLTIHVDDTAKYKIGDVLYGVPVHICPTVALYDEAQVVVDNEIAETWEVTARSRKIEI